MYVKIVSGINQTENMEFTLEQANLIYSEMLEELEDKLLQIS